MVALGEPERHHHRPDTAPKGPRQDTEQFPLPPNGSPVCADSNRDKGELWIECELLGRTGERVEARAERCDFHRLARLYREQKSLFLLSIARIASLHEVEGPAVVREILKQSTQAAVQVIRIA